MVVTVPNLIIVRWGRARGQPVLVRAAEHILRWRPGLPHCEALPVMSMVPICLIIALSRRRVW